MLTTTEKQALEQISVDGAWALLESITSFPREHPRDVDRAMTIVAEQLQAAKIPAFVDEMSVYLSLPGKASVNVNGRTLRAKASSMSKPVPGGLTAEVVYIPGNKDMIAALLPLSGSKQSTAPAELDDAMRRRIRGSIVVTDGFAGPGEVASFAPLGAIGIIAISPGEEIHSAICSSIWGNPTVSTMDQLPGIPVVGVNRADGEVLIQAAREGGKATIFSELEQGWFPSKYLRVDIASSVDPDSFVLVHGHLDSWDIGVGDNATGDVLLFEVARLLWENRAHLRRSVRIAWWPGHSTGRYAGSTWFADNFALDLADNCVAHINCDSPGCRWATEYRDVCCMPEASQLLHGVVNDALGLPVTTTRAWRAGDWSFTNIGVTGLLCSSSTMPMDLVKRKGYYRVGGNGGNIEWHTERDLLEIADPAVLKNDIAVYFLAAFRLAAADIVPLDFRSAAAEYQSTLRKYSDAAGDVIDMSAARVACQELTIALQAFQAQIEKGTLPHRVANQAILELERTLVPINHARLGQFQQDLALPLPELPALALAMKIPTLPKELHQFAATQLIRGRNEVVAAFKAGSRCINRALMDVTAG